MPIIDLWANPTTATVLTMAGYTPSTGYVTSHRLFPMILSTIREMDINHVGLVYRWLMTLDTQWQDTDAKIRALPNLRSVDDCPDEYLTYLRRDVGILDDLAYLWEKLTIVEQRLLLKYFVFICQSRGSTAGVVSSLIAMTGRPVRIFDYFFYRWILSGTGYDEDETALGFEMEPGDPWLLTEENMPSGFRPESAEYLSSPSYGNYWFMVTTEMTNLVNPPIPSHLIVKYVPNNSIAFAKVVKLGNDYYAVCLMNETFGLDPTNTSSSIGDFLLYVEIDQYVTDIAVEDTKDDLNRDAIVGIVRFSRPLSERVYVRYYSMIEEFANIDRWTNAFLTSAALASGIVTLTADAVVDGGFYFENDADGNPEYTWDTYEFKCRMSVPEASCGVWVGPCVNLFDAGAGVAGYAFRVSVVSKIVGGFTKVPNAFWHLEAVTLGGGAGALISAGTFASYDVDTYYTFRMSMYEEGGIRWLRVYRDEELIIENGTIPAGTVGSVGFSLDPTGILKIKGLMMVQATPVVYDYIGV
mgnify:CR=1 FL=1